MIINNASLVLLLILYFKGKLKLLFDYCLNQAPSAKNPSEALVRMHVQIS